MSRLVFDIGGTHMRVALAENGAIGRAERFATPHAPADGIEAVRAFLEKSGARPEEAVGGIAGTVHGGIVGRTTYLQGWDGFDIGRSLLALGIARTRLLNDAELAGIGEALTGAGKGKRAVGYVTVSTGIGGALIVDGRPVPHGDGQEPGKEIIDFAAMRTLEDLASGGALEKQFGVPPERLDHAILLGRIPALAAGLYDIIRLWSPDILVLGGSLMNDATGYPLDAVVEGVRSLPVVLPPLPPIVRSALGDDAGLVGAALLED